GQRRIVGSNERIGDADTEPGVDRVLDAAVEIGEEMEIPRATRAVVSDPEAGQDSALSLRPVDQQSETGRQGRAEVVDRIVRSDMEVVSVLLGDASRGVKFENSPRYGEAGDLHGTGKISLRRWWWRLRGVNGRRCLCSGGWDERRDQVCEQHGEGRGSE